MAFTCAPALDEKYTCVSGIGQVLHLWTTYWPSEGEATGQSFYTCVTTPSSAAEFGSAFYCSNQILNWHSLLLVTVWH